MLIVVLALGLTACSAGGSGARSQSASPTPGCPPPAQAPSLAPKDGWRLVAALPDDNLTDVAVSKDGSVWTVGSRHLHGAPEVVDGCEYKTIAGNEAVVKRMDAVGWRELPLPRCADNLRHRLATRPRAIDALGPDQIWVAGDGLRLSHWDGGRWSTVPVPRINLRDEVKPKVVGHVGVDDLLVLGPHDVWMSATVVTYEKDATEEVPFRRALLLHWNGSSWWWQLDQEGSHHGQLAADADGNLLTTSGLVSITGRQRRPIALPVGERAPMVNAIAFRPGTRDAWAVGVLSGYGEADSFAAIWTNAPKGSAPHEEPAPSPVIPTPTPSPSLAQQDE
ncbi:hypothetical protein GCM10009560_41000 [Nonomuraea longicatena]|uniref:Uncharacterized protein n=2 Tax=Nonomuraea longicatena TaxID=83682 RepID=A0ABP4ADF6_9ACTN